MVRFVLTKLNKPHKIFENIVGLKFNMPNNNAFVIA